MIRHKNELRNRSGKFMCVPYILNFANKIYKYNLSKIKNTHHTHTLNIISNVFHFRFFNVTFICLYVWH